MSALYLDASAILRVVFDEEGEKAPITKTKTSVASSKLALVEVARALERARLQHLVNDDEAAALSKTTSDLFETFHLVSLDDSIITMAQTPFHISVRALDALHVATAQVLQHQIGKLTFWTHDERQGRTALIRGLDVRGIE